MEHYCLWWRRWFRISGDRDEKVYLESADGSKRKELLDPHMAQILAMAADMGDNIKLIIEPAVRSKRRVKSKYA